MIDEGMKSRIETKLIDTLNKSGNSFDLYNAIKKAAIGALNNGQSPQVRVKEMLIKLQQRKIPLHHYLSLLLQGFISMLDDIDIPSDKDRINRLLQNLNL